jgi:hypothetical protein
MNTRLCAVLTSILISLPFGVLAQTQVPDAANSYFVPQAGEYATPIEGSDAIRFFRACPNNDGGSVLPNKARIKVVLKDVSDVPIEGLPGDRIYVHFNGGTEKQGFFGDGADSIIANGVENPGGACPLVQYLYADGPTDATGTTYITFTGAGGVRDPDRKWGHYDSELPVIANGVQLQGRLSSDGGTNGEYVLRIKNVDIKGGLQNGLDHGEEVTSVDYNTFRSHIGDPPDDLTYWRDLDSNGTYGSSDFSIMVSHQDHGCDDAPMSP